MTSYGKELWIIYVLLDDDVPMVRLGALELLNVAEPDRKRFALIVERMKADSDSRVVELAHVFAP
ncbi:hypothetical protein [Labedaea rhizosphaerae]|uniref:HEAT repeat protein n=1 Tax=Labedaea rhizosphaerae TaxID=598644 RepID=A0A4R6SE21_LABRH|nr:hypothetical protein [Labedaea rhizosphaerae]TDP97944.1 hypothetical protein EV186_103924 [Labedaea rhizosphaerae]